MNIDNDNPSSKVKAVNSSNWEQEVIEASKTMPVFVDFWAEWCTPCKMFAPILDRVAEDMSDKVKFVKLNVDEFPEISQRYGVMAIPNLVFIANGEVSYQQPGLVPESKFREISEQEVQKMMGDNMQVAA